MEEEQLNEVLIYPKNPKLKKAYIAILGLIQQKKAVRFSVFEAGEAICDYMGWILDYDPKRYNKAPGPKYKQCLRLLRNLEGSFIYFPTPTANIIEVCVYDIINRKRVTNFEQLFVLFENDIHASEFGGVQEDLIFTPWEDKYHTVTEEDEILIMESVEADIQRVEMSTPLCKDVIESSFESEYTTNPSVVLKKYIKDLESGCNQPEIEGV